MSDNQGASSQAGQQGQGSGTQASQGGGQGNQQSLGDQLYGSQGQQGQSQSGTGEGQLLPGQKAGESLADYATRMTSELTRARQDAGKYRTRLRQYEGDGVDADGQTSGGQGQQQGQGQQGTQGNQQQGNDPVAARIERLERELQAERNARKAERTTSSLTNALTNAGAINPARAVRLIDSEGLQVGSDGTPTPESVQEAIEALKAEMPTIFTDTRGSGDGGAGNAGAGEPDDFNAQIRRRAGIRR